jgi:quercetin dioxygenase-like cupin family protein
MRMLHTNEPIGFVAAQLEKIQWVDVPEIPAVQAAVLLGDPEKAGPFVIRVRLPPNFQVEPHTHREGRTYTIISGEWNLGFGDKFDPRQFKTFGQGGFYRLPAGVVHFQAAGRHGTIIQIEGVGPSSTDFLRPEKKTWSIPSEPTTGK